MTTEDIQPISIDPNDLLKSVFAGVADLPVDPNPKNFLFNKSQSRLEPFEDSALTRDQFWEGMSIDVDEGTRGKEVWLGRYHSPEAFSSSGPSLHCEFNDDGRMERVVFDDGMGTDPTVRGIFETQGNKLVSRGNIYMPIVNSLSFISPHYVGDEKTFHFSHVVNYTVGQIAIVFAGGLVPDVDVQKYMYKTMFSREWESARRELALPQLNFKRHEHDYAPGGNRAHLVYEGNNRPSVEVGQVIKGVAFKEEDILKSLPFGVTVQINSLHEESFEYTSGPGMAAIFEGDVVINDGTTTKSTTVEARVNCDLSYLKKNPAMIPSRAFAAIHPSSRK